MPGGVIEPLPRNLTDTTRVLVRLPGANGVANHPLTGELAGLSVEAALPIRRFYSWKGKRNYEGRWWCSTSRSHVEFESLLERDALMMADFDVDVVAVTAPDNCPVSVQLAGFAVNLACDGLAANSQRSWHLQTMPARGLALLRVMSAPRSCGQD